VPVRLLVPYGRESVLAELRQLGGLEGTDFQAAGTMAWGWVPSHALHRFSDFRVS